MAKPKKLTLSEENQNLILTLFQGSKKMKPVQGARSLAKRVNVPSRQVMLFLEQKKLRKYSKWSY